MQLNRTIILLCYSQETDQWSATRENELLTMSNEIFQLYVTGYMEVHLLPLEARNDAVEHCRHFTYWNSCTDRRVYHLRTPDIV